VIKRGSQATCGQPGCDSAYYARGYCSLHYDRWKTHGDPTVVKTGGHPLKGQYPTFAGLHRRLYRQRGKAAEHLCVDCGQRARDWSYMHDDPDEKTQIIGGVAVPYSLELSHYEPRCRRCHMVFDRRAPLGINGNTTRRACKRGHPFDAINTHTRSDGARTCKTCQRARTIAYRERKKRDAVDS
jgi:hypothetical protein